MKMHEVIREVFREAARSGAPLYVTRIGGNYVEIETPHGKFVYIIRVLKDIEDDGVRYLALGVDYGFGEVVLAKLGRQGEVEEEYPWMAPIAVALNMAAFRNYEADVWSKRIRWMVEDEFRVVEDEGDLQVIEHTEQPCMAVRLRGERLYIGWYQKLLGRVECSKEWIAKWFKVEEEKMEEACELLRRVGVRHKDLLNGL
ncbi:hypothetical protein [Stetteria hydrogenophila]